MGEIAQYRVGKDQGSRGGDNAMNDRSPMQVSDKRIRKALQLAGLRFACSRALWVNDECKKIGVALKEGKLTTEEVDLQLEAMGMLDLVYPELMGR